MTEMEFPYNLPIWRSTFQLESPDGKLLAEIPSAWEVSMGNPTIGILKLSNGFELDRCNPSFIWSDDSRYLVVPRYFNRFGFFRRQRVVLIVTRAPHSDASLVKWGIPEDLNQFDSVREVSWP